MDFYKILLKVKKDGTLQVYPDWQVTTSTDLMVQNKTFYAFWDEASGLWSTDQLALSRLVDKSLFEYAKTEIDKGTPYEILTTMSFSSKVWEDFNRFMRNHPDNSVPLDSVLTFSNTPVSKGDYVSKRLSYSLEHGTTAAWDELAGVLYSQEELDKIEWAIGAIVSGESKFLQKFLVLYGPPASGKSTILNVVQKLFQGYTATFDAKALGSNGNGFAMDVFRDNPLVAIQHDGDLSKIEDNTKLNSITAHEDMVINEKFKAGYTARINAFLFMGTNKPVHITDSKSGIIRRLIDVHPTGARVEAERYHILVEQINFELGAIAFKCRAKFREMGKHYYNGYKPVQMMYQTDEFYNFIAAHYFIFQEEGITLKRAWALYKEYCEEVNIKRLMRYAFFREELGQYFESFEDRATIGDEVVRSYYSGFKGLPESTPFVADKSYAIAVDDAKILYADGVSVFDRTYANQPAQLAGLNNTPKIPWAENNVQLKDIDPSKLHYVQIPMQHIVIDFDLTDEDGEKDIERNLEEASKWPPTYTELSKSGAGVHLHYLYAGDVTELASVYDVGIEIKTLLGGQSLRRKLTKCNTLDIATISAGLPKKEKPMLNIKHVTSEKGLRDLIERNLRKEIHPGTKPSIDFIHSILEDAYAEGLAYDLTDMKPRILQFALKSSNQSVLCVKLVQTMKFASETEMETTDTGTDERNVFYDVEVYPNLFVICWKFEDAPEDSIVRMINPTPEQVEELFQLKLIGFNNRRYDNHIIYARFLGRSNEELFHMSQQIVEKKNRHALFREAYNLSYTDIFDFTSKKQGLKKYMIELGIHHMELDIPWDKPVPERLWPVVVDYCANDVMGTEATFKARKEDFIARQILAELSGLTVNHTTQNHTAKIIFGDDKKPQEKFVYTDLSERFPGYVYEGGKSTYRGEVTGEGGYVYAEPGIYENVALLDVASMHPASIENLELFGPYTKNFSALKEARMAIKHRDYDTARRDDVLNGGLKKFLVDAEDDPSSAEALSYALKIVINIVYGLTSAQFDNPFRDIRNVDNIVAKRGALFMIDLKHEVQARGFTVAHIKTDSIKIPNATQEIIDFVFDFGKQYGYDFEHEATYEKFCLVNDAVYIARSGDKWTAVGKQFQQPYVYKTLFSGEPIEFDDFCETRNVVQGTMYFAPSGVEEVEDMIHIGRTGSFVPVRYDGHTMWRVKDGKKYAVTGTKGHLWIDRTIARQRDETGELLVDMDYFEDQRNDAQKAIEQFGSFEDFIS